MPHDVLKHKLLRRYRQWLRDELLIDPHGAIMHILSDVAEAYPEEVEQIRTEVLKGGEEWKG